MIDVAKLFEVVEKEGLGRVLKCKLCSRRNLEFIVMSPKDAERHFQYHLTKSINLTARGNASERR